MSLVQVLPQQPMPVGSWLKRPRTLMSESLYFEGSDVNSELPRTNSRRLEKGQKRKTKGRRMELAFSYYEIDAKYI